MNKTQKVLFRIGTTSYIYPDNVIPNVHKLKDKINDVELILFETSDENSILSQKDLKELINIGKEKDLTYTVHLPLKTGLGSGTENKRKWSINNIILLINYFAVLGPHSYVLHLDLSARAEKNIKRWQGRVNDSIKCVLKKVKVDSVKIAVENLDYPFSYVEDIVADNNLSICIDIGHLITAGVNVEKHLDRHLNKTRVIHFHGVDKGKDHVSLKYLDKKFIKSILWKLRDRGYRGVFTLEIFSQSDFEESMNVLNKYV